MHDRAARDISGKIHFLLTNFIGGGGKIFEINKRRGRKDVCTEKTEIHMA